MIDPGELYHVGVAVADLEAAERRYSSDLGIGPWVDMTSSVRAEYRGRTCESKVRFGYARSGAIFIELVQPLDGPSSAAAFLSERGEGVYHLGFWCPDVEASLERAASAGIGVDWSARDGDGTLFAYLDADAASGVHIELVRTSLRTMLEDWIASAGR